MGKQIFKYTIVFLGGVFLLAGMLVLCAMIPQSYIRENVKISGEMLCKGELFAKRIAVVESSKIDRYADSILLGIAYSYDNGHPLKAVMESKYYHTDIHNENENLLTAVTKHREGNQQYLRYWHGSNIIVRPLLVICNIKQIYMINGVVLALLCVMLFLQLYWKKAWVPMIGMALGLIMTSVWFVPLSLEYTWTYLLMLVLSMIGIHLICCNHYQQIGVFFLVSGMVTNFFDFLTTETITVTVPLLLMLWMAEQKNQQNEKAAFRFAGKNLLLWGIGYTGMWMMKWLIASIVLSENVLPYVVEHVEERIGGNIGVDSNGYILGAIWNNIKCLFPFDYGTIGAILGTFLILYTIYLAYVYHCERVNGKRILLYVLIGFIPYIRYIVLHNHSYLHCFFTYRAQIAVILVVILILEQLTGGSWLRRKR